MAEGHRIERLATQAAHAPTPFEALRSAGELRRELDTFERRQVARALSEGATFAQIARHLGLSRQAVHRRFRSVAETEPSLPPSTQGWRLLHLAREEAAALAAGLPGGEHVLLASLRGDDPAAGVLRDAGATLEQARQAPAMTGPTAPLFQPGAGRDDLRTVLAAAAAEAKRRGDHEIEIAHLLLGALEDDDGGAAGMLRALDVDVDGVRDALGELVTPQAKS